MHQDAGRADLIVSESFARAGSRVWQKHSLRASIGWPAMSQFLKRGKGVGSRERRVSLPYSVATGDSTVAVSAPSAFAAAGFREILLRIGWRIGEEQL